MRGVSLTIAVVATLAGLALPSPLAAQEGEPQGKSSAPPGDDASPPATKQQKSPLASKLPQDAAAALVRASAAYEYGDMNQVVDAARPVAEGLLPATAEEQIQAFRLLGIGLYLTNRPLGAETAFTELLRKDPRARLDPTSTRPELVAFFESLRHQQMARQRSTRKMFWNFIPPVGQFQNDDHVKGWVILGVGVAAGATAATTFGIYQSWKLSHDMSKHPDTAQTLKTVNIVSGAVLAAVYIYGVVDGLIGYGKPVEDSAPLSLHLFPGGGGLGFTF
jgi:F0F1-type ATP synthase membrane subunit c/vacuolar-type H+-ATPase subunit K